ncbi:MAG: hypothetical protein K2H09_09675 [Treponemataceae bacterium]|nr:hypothetical protein [Treponemataceae bacterium]
MKLEPLFKSEGNALFLIAGNVPLRTMPAPSVPLEQVAAASGGADAADGAAALERVYAVVLPRPAVELSPGTYNEEALAVLRADLKRAEERGAAVFFVPAAGGALDSADDAAAWISALVHAARRIKDCANVVGFAVPPEFLAKDAAAGLGADSWSRWFADELSVKHGQYLYFADADVVHQNALDAEVAKTDFILYKM